MRPTTPPVRRAARALATALATTVATALARPAAAQLTLVVAAPPGTPAADTLRVAGAFNGWNPAAPGAALARLPDGRWTVTLPTGVRGRVEFKLTRGTWATVETTADGRDVPNRVADVPATGADTVRLEVAAWRDRVGAPPAARSTATRSVRVVADSFPIPALGRTRRVWVYLPPGYAAAPRRRYPVLYLQDGQNVFDAATAFSGEWGVDETLDALARRGDPGVIVVAVDHGGPRRLDEYNPWRHPDPRLGGGEGDAYLAWLAGTLKPWVDRRWRTRPEPAHTVLGGSSMGGLVALAGALRRPDVFGGAAVFSCACWIARDSVLALAARPTPRRPGQPPPRLYFVVGARETADGGPARDQAAVVAALRTAGWRPGRDLRAEVRPEGTHSEGFWRQEFPAAYRWLFDGGSRR